LTLLIPVVIVTCMCEHAIESDEDGEECASSGNGPTYSMLVPVDTVLKKGGLTEADLS